MKKHICWMLAGIFLSGCTVVSANRVFPKLDWYWSADAKEQRRSREWERTNRPPVIKAENP